MLQWRAQGPMPAGAGSRRTAGPMPATTQRKCPAKGQRKGRPHHSPKPSLEATPPHGSSLPQPRRGHARRWLGWRFGLEGCAGGLCRRAGQAGWTGGSGWRVGSAGWASALSWRSTSTSTTTTLTITPTTTALLYIHIKYIIDVSVA